MYYVIWEYEVFEGKTEAFEELFTVEGKRTELFAEAEGFKGTELLSDHSGNSKYLCIDKWESRWRYQAFTDQFRLDFTLFSNSVNKLAKANFVGEYSGIDQLKAANNVLPEEVVTTLEP